MGYYTRFQCSFTLKKDTPLEIINYLKHVITSKFNDNWSDEVEKLKNSDYFNHSFFKCSREISLFIGSNGCEQLEPRYFTISPNGYYKLKLNSKFKDYDCEIYKFIDWIQPYIAGRKKKHFIGWYKGEDFTRTNIYRNEDFKEVIKLYCND